MLVKLLIAALALLLVLFNGLIWLVADLAHITLWLPVGVTSFFVLTGACIFLYRKLKASGAALGLERALKAQAKEQVKLVRPDLQAEVEHMQGEFDKAVGALKSAKLGPGGRNALYFLPWYAIIGPPGAGKSTALRSSGLHFPYTSGTGGAAVKGLGGTRNCDWWLTNEAVVLDTAGRWSTQDEDRDEWLSFLGLLKRYRPKKPLNGLIAAISVGDVVNAREEEVEALAERMRARLDEVQTQLRVSIPVYVLFTKSDLVEGFLETFGDLRRSERGQVWGFTVPLSAERGATAELFRSRFEELAGTLENRSLARIADERSVERRALIYAFPQQFMALRRNLERFIEVMFKMNVYQTTPALRGVYFTSGTQEGRPFNLLMDRLVEAMGIKRKLVPSEAALDQKSYFLHDVFMNVIFEDRDVASASERELKRRRGQRWIVSAALGVVSLIVGIVPSYAYSLNKYQLLRLSAAVDDWEAPGRAPLDDHKKLEQLEPLRARVDSLLGYERDGAPLMMGFGMYQADRLAQPLRRYYANLLRRELVQPLLRREAEALSDFGLRYASLPAQQRPTEQEHDAFYPALRLQLVLSRPKQASEPALEEDLRAWLETQLRERWLPSAGDDKALQHAVHTNAALYTEFAGELPELAFPRDQEVVEKVRSALNRVPAIDRALDKLIAAAARQNYELGVYDLVGEVSVFRDVGKVRGAFTRRGYENVVRDAITTDLLDDVAELWVLGTADEHTSVESQRDEQLVQLRNKYFRSYVEEWNNFLRRLRIATPSPPSVPATLQLFRDLTGASPPIAGLLQRVNANLQLPRKVSAKQIATSIIDDVTKGIQKYVKTKAQNAPLDPVAPRSDAPEQLDEAYVARELENVTNFAVSKTATEGAAPAPLPVDTYQEQLNRVTAALQIYVDDETASDQVIPKLRDAKVSVAELINRRAATVKPIFENLLEPPLRAALEAVAGAGLDQHSDQFCSGVYAEFARALGGHYPFNRNGQDAALADFSNFYRPKQGRLWAVVDGAFGKALQFDGDRYAASPRLGESGGSYAPVLFEFLNRSREIMLAYFPTGASEPSVEFEVKVRPSPLVATTIFSVGGASVEHQNGPEKWRSLIWPGADPAAGASILIKGANGMQERFKGDGPWGLFRLLEDGSLLPGAGRTFSVAWQPQTHDVTLVIDFRPKRSESPFLGTAGRPGAEQLMAPVRGSAANAPRSIGGGKACR